MQTKVVAFFGKLKIVLYHLEGFICRDFFTSVSFGDIRILPCSKSKRRSYPSSTSTSTVRWQLATTIYLRFYVKQTSCNFLPLFFSQQRSPSANYSDSGRRGLFFVATLFLCCSHEPATLPKALASLVGTSPLAALLLPLPGIVESGPCVTTNGHFFVSALGHRRRRSRRNAKHPKTERHALKRFINTNNHLRRIVLRAHQPAQPGPRAPQAAANALDRRCQRRIQQGREVRAIV